VVSLAKLEEGLTLNDETEEVASGMHKAGTKLSVLNRLQKVYLTGSVELIVGGNVRYHHLRFDLPLRWPDYKRCISPVTQS
jgi:hypothetical protein